MHFDSTITVGNLIEIAVTLITVVAAYFKLVNRVTGLEIKVNLMWEKMFPESNLFRFNYKKKHETR